MKLINWTRDEAKRITYLGVFRKLFSFSLSLVFNEIFDVFVYLNYTEERILFKLLLFICFLRGILSFLYLRLVGIWQKGY